ncbi:MAG: peptidoglycan DD-metalloendopeptidase family protein [Oscillospiraceae bacterium]|nr:peptidoglycan DD-metalloendopeptidase family protein [Oscillospiraceae bacterium]
MIKALFLKIFNMSITASVVILAVMFIRWLFRNQPKIYSYILWSMVLFRLLCPYSISLNTSLFNILPPASVNNGQIEYDIPEFIHPEITEQPISDKEVTAPFVDTVVSQQLQEDIVTDNYFSAPDKNVIVAEEKTSVDFIEIISVLWLFGGMYIMLNNLISIFEIKNILNSSTHLKDNIYLNNIIPTAFISGVLRPRIYLPDNLGDEQQKYILLHEQTHIRRKDYIFKLLGFVAVCLHWFNPLVWVAFNLAENDMEMSCDEAVIRNMTVADKKSYSHTLIEVSCNSYNIMLPAFGKKDTKGRIMNILNYKKPKALISVFMVVTIAFSIVACSANPVENNSEPAGDSIIEENIPSVNENVFSVVREDDTDIYSIGKTAMELYFNKNHPDGNYVIVINAITYSATDEHTSFEDTDFTGEFDYGVPFVYMSDDIVYEKILFIKDIGNDNYEIVYIDDASYSDTQHSSTVEHAGTFIWPVSTGMVSRGFAGQYPSHNGLDIAAPTGTDIFAVADGVVTKAYYTEVGDGIYCEIDHGDYQTLYAHCSELNVEIGQEVKQGDVIAYVGSTGNSTGPHLHFEVKNGDERYDPYSWF